MTDSAEMFSCAAERVMSSSPAELYTAWTHRFDLWFAAAGSVVMRAQVHEPFFFETEFDGTRHPHYGRFLRLEADRLVELTWVTAGTAGAETRVLVEFELLEDRTLLRLTHSGFTDAALADQHGLAWPLVLDQLEERMISTAQPSPGW
ncbi:SRPBCC family protein [Glaciibacter superstes]|uniref:SRPBCC family protein n=1 Tax=Glaciibacter superstes TaxID=501023 RepID=UPI0003B2E825|nr:SRPBCC domain-containing protein [Glaciibacter superstes]